MKLKVLILLFLITFIIFMLAGCADNIEHIDIPLIADDTTSALPPEEIEVYLTPVYQGELRISLNDIISLATPDFDSAVWSSDNPYIVEIDESGRAIGRHKAGVTQITAKTPTVVYTWDIVNTVTMRDSAFDIVADMNIGVNIASFYDGIHESAWSGLKGVGYDGLRRGMNKINHWIPTIAETVNAYYLTDIMYEAGYDAARFTISWTPHIHNETFIIDEAWLDEVEKAVNHILNKGMYCVINAHYDYMNYSWTSNGWRGDWMIDEHKEYVDARFAALWRQVAERFKDYSDYLMFEAMNEPVMTWTVAEELGGYDVYMDISVNRINEMNDIFVNTVRNSGGFNNTRFLWVEPANFGHAEFLDKLTLTEHDYIIASTHYYPMADGWWTDEPPVYLSEAEVREQFELIRQFTEKTGIPVIMGEWALSGFGDGRMKAALQFLSIAKEYGVPCFWWEACEGSPPPPDYAWMNLYYRGEDRWKDPDLVFAMMDLIYND
jgi:endoglucanase